MALINCEECGKEMSENATVCPHCGNPNKSTKKNDDNNLGTILGLIIGILLLIFGIYHMTSGTSKMLNNSNDDKLHYDEVNDVYTYTIWEDKNFTNSDDIIWLDE